jgi:hypothetical protein
VDLETGGFKPELILIENEDAVRPSLRLMGMPSRISQVNPEPSQQSGRRIQKSTAPDRLRRGKE